MDLQQQEIQSSQFVNLQMRKYSIFIISLQEYYLSSHQILRKCNYHAKFIKLP